MRSMDDYIMAPHSRYTEVRREDVEKHPELIILSESNEAGLFLIMSRDGRQIFVQGHPEYDRMTLDGEYHRDLGKGINPQIPGAIIMKMMIQRRNRCYAGEIWPIRFTATAELLCIPGNSL